MGDNNPQQNTMWMFFRNFSNKFSIPDFVNGNDKRGRKHISYDRIGTHEEDKSDFLSSSNPHLLDIVGNGRQAQVSELDAADVHVDDSYFHSKLSSPNVNAPSKANNTAKSLLTASHTTPSLSSVATTNNVSSTANMVPASPPPPRSKPTPRSSVCSSTSATFTSASNRFGSIFNRGGGGRSVDFNLKTKKFVFPNRVPSYQADQQGEKGEKRRQKVAKTNITENVKDANWLEIEDGDEDSDDDEDDDDDGKGGNYDGASSCSSDYEEDEEDRNGTRCGICGCEKKYEEVARTEGGGFGRG